MTFYCIAYGHKIKITEEQFIAAERVAGFRPKYGNGKATGGFSSGSIRYSIEY